MVRVLLILLALVASTHAGDFSTGCYTGDGAAPDRTITTGYCSDDASTFCATDDDCGDTCTTFQPDLVLVRHLSTSSAKAWFANSDMSMPDSCKFSEFTSTDANCATDKIQSFVAAGFTVDTSLNTSSVSYCWFALKEAANEMAVGGFVGNGSCTGGGGADCEDVTLGWEPEAVFLFREDGGASGGTFWRSNEWQDAVVGASPTPTPDPTSSNVDNFRLQQQTNMITDITATGFTVGNLADVNTVQYWWWAIAGASVEVGSWAGDRADADDTQRAISLSSAPVWVFVTNTTKGAANNKEACAGWRSTETAASPYIYSAVNADWQSGLYALTASSEFTVANAAASFLPDCNKTTRQYRYVAYSPSSATAAAYKRFLFW